MLHPSTRCGELFLRFAKQGQKTTLAESFFRTPLQVMQPISDATGCLYIYLLSPTGGVVQGDQYAIKLVAEENSHAVFTTQSATKVYRMPAQGAFQRLEIDLHAGAILEFIPDALILFKGADFCQEIHITLQPGALLLLHDVVMPGRLARGEFLEFKRYKNRLVVRDEKGLLLYDNATLTPETADYQAMGILEGYACWGNWYLLGALQHYQLDPLQFCQTYLPLVEGLPNVLGSLSPLHRDGVCGRFLSHHLSPLYAAFESLRQAFRTQYLQLPLIPLRK